MTKCYHGNFILEVIIVRHSNCYLSASSIEHRGNGRVERFTIYTAVAQKPRALNSVSNYHILESSPQFGLPIRSNSCPVPTQMFQMGHTVKERAALEALQ